MVALRSKLRALVELRLVDFFSVFFDGLVLSINTSNLSLGQAPVVVRPHAAVREVLPRFVEHGIVAHPFHLERVALGVEHGVVPFALFSVRYLAISGRSQIQLDFGLSAFFCGFHLSSLLTDMSFPGREPAILLLPIILVGLLQGHLLQTPGPHLGVLPQLTSRCAWIFPDKGLGGGLARLHSEAKLAWAGRSSVSVLSPVPVLLERLQFRLALLKVRLAPFLHNE